MIPIGTIVCYTPIHLDRPEEVGVVRAVSSRPSLRPGEPVEVTYRIHMENGDDVYHLPAGAISVVPTVVDHCSYCDSEDRRELVMRRTQHGRQMICAECWDVVRPMRP